MARLGCECLEEVPLDPYDKPSPHDLSIMFGVLENKTQLLSGGPIARVELCAPGAAGHSSLVAHLKELKTAHDQQMGYGAGNPPAKEVTGESWLITRDPPAEPSPAAGEPGAPGEGSGAPDPGPGGQDPGGGGEDNEEVPDNESEASV
ncbi:MAG: hypothetical protein HQ559_11245 [Lentisphaerae bacterium]|nr:hypothetical protein [Lentisphaerota bacterium]